MTKESRFSCLASGMSEVLAKPISSGELFSAILTCLGESHGDFSTKPHRAGEVAEGAIDFHYLMEEFEDPQVIENLILKFLGDLNETIPKLASDLEKGNIEKLDSELHRLKGSAASVGLCSVRKLVSKQDPNEDMFDSLRNESELVRESLQKWMDGFLKKPA